MSDAQVIENVEQISARVTNEEKETCKALGRLLHKQKKISDPTISEAIRFMIHFTAGVVLQGIEARRLGSNPP